MVPGDSCRELEDGQMSDYKLLIDGKLVSGAMALNVVNPATEEVVAVAPRADRAQLEQAVAAAKAAFPRWSRRRCGNAVRCPIRRPQRRQMTIVRCDPKSNRRPVGALLAASRPGQPSDHRQEREAF
jgi:hypothetical protein